MKVSNVQLVLRYHVVFNKEESDYLRAMDFLHPLSKPETDMWLTHAEIEHMKEMFPDLAGAVDNAVAQASDLAAQARHEFLTMMDNTL